MSGLPELEDPAVRACAQAYLWLLRTPLDSRDRIELQSLLGLLRDTVAGAWNIPAEEVQAAFEMEAANGARHEV